MVAMVIGKHNAHTNCNFHNSQERTKKTHPNRIWKSRFKMVQREREKCRYPALALEVARIAFLVISRRKI